MQKVQECRDQLFAIVRRRLDGERLALLGWYCSPAIMALVFVLMLLGNRSLGVGKELRDYMGYIQEHKAAPPKPSGNDLVFERLGKFLSAAQQWGTLAELQQRVTSDVLSVFISNSLFIAALSLLPFLILGGGMAYHSPPRRGPAELQRLVLQDWPMKYFVGVVMAFGWSYVFYPFGWAASTVYSYVVLHDKLSADTLPFYVAYKAEMKATVAGFLGWYLYLLGYFFYRFQKGDVASGKVYRTLFRKFLFVFGVALVLSAIPGKEVLLLVFLIGFLPLSAISLLREFAGRSVAGLAEQRSSLSVLPGISRWHIQRLEEEEVEDVVTLASANPEELAQAIPPGVVDPSLLAYWVDVARLISIVGPDKYEKLRGIATTASEFIARASEAEFKDLLIRECQFHNPEELASTMAKVFAGR